MNRHSLVVIAAVVTVLVVVVLLAMPVKTTGIAVAGRAQSRNHLEQIGLALHAYHDDHGVFPPAFTMDAAGARTHSWRVLLLPYLDQVALYDKWDLNRPWDSSENSELHMPIEVFRFPGDARAGLETRYLAIMGEGTGWSGEIGSDEMTDGPSSTIAIVEVPDSDVLWMEPGDIDIEDLDDLVERLHEVSAHGEGFHILMWGPDPRRDHGFSRQVAFIEGKLTVEELRRLVTIAQGDCVELVRDIDGYSVDVRLCQ